MADGRVIEWPRVALGEVLVHVARPVTVGPSETYREIGIRSHGKGIFHKEPVVGMTLGEKSVFALEPGDFVLNIVFAWEGAVALVSEAERGMIGSHRFPAFRARDARLDLGYLHLYLRSKSGLALLDRVSPGGAGRNRTLSRTAFLAEQIPLPPLTEQRRIVARVADLCAKVDEAAGLRDSLNDGAKVLRDAVVDRLLGASVPETCRLGDLAVVRSGIQKGPHREPAAHPVRYLTVAHVQRNHILWDDPRFFEVKPTELERWLLRAGDVLVIEGNGSPEEIGRAAVFGGEVSPCVHQNHVLRLRPDVLRVLPEYLALYLNSSRGRLALQKLGRTSSGLVTLSAGRLGDVEIEVPSLVRQQEIIHAVAQADIVIGSYATHTIAQADELHALRSAVIERAVRGEL